MADGGYTILHRKDERGVIVESKVFGPDDDTEGFEAAEYQPVYAPREDDQEPVAESKLTPWTSQVGKGTWVEQTNEAAAEAEAEAVAAEDDGGGLPVPPKGGPGSGVDVWAAYAADNDVEIEDGATRDEIIAACVAADVPVD